LRASHAYIRGQAGRHCRAHADDATQEAMWTMYSKLGTLRSAAAFPAWLGRIIARICFGLVAPLWRQIEALKQADADTAAEAVPVELRIDLANAVDALPDTYREVVFMHYFEDLPVADIAARLGIREGAAKVRLHRGREQLRAHLVAADGPL